MNMSYCRFTNTLQDLRDCYNNMDGDDELSTAEQTAKEKLIKLCARIAVEYSDDFEQVTQ
jgi:hypothetical protein